MRWNHGSPVGAAALFFPKELSGYLDYYSVHGYGYLARLTLIFGHLPNTKEVHSNTSTHYRPSRQPSDLTQKMRGNTSLDGF